ncbi:CHAT domain-containing protein [Paenibacillus sp. LMG 31460]|uniref:CHAT domain-containing protein n=1 Tax=Paenibacillus germinis TaxID=2654979 RepID=A0ABX1ZAI0_9BACL|nr:CHAT domain-containing protein [Paenibacillus germinis]NOU88850.1 CHAT domain-containing protein [Paenibacillus germinis]
MKELNDLFDELFIIKRLNTSKIRQCKRILSKKLLPKIVLQLHQIIIYVLNETEPHYYYELRKTVDLFNSFTTKYFETLTIKPEDLFNTKNSEEVINSQILIGTMIVNCRFSWILEKIGLPGESYKYLMKSFDPFIEIYNRDTHIGEAHLNQSRFFMFDLYWRANMLENPYLREAYLQREILQLKLRSTMGDINHEGLNDYLFMKDLIILGNDATKSDVIYLCALGEFLNKYHRDDERLNETIDRLSLQLNFEINKNNHNVFDIANTLFLITKNLTYFQIALNSATNGLLDTQKLEAAHLILKLRIINSRSSFNVEELTSAYENLFNVINTSFADAILNKLIRQSYSQVIIDLVLFCLEINRWDLAMEFAYRWKVNELYDSEMKSVVLFTISNMVDNNVIHILRVNDTIKVLKKKNSISLSEIFELQSKIEGTWMVSLENPDSFVYDYQNLGNIDVSLSNKYEEMIEEYFNLKLLEQEILRLDKSLEIRTFELSWSNIPFIPLLESNTNYNFSSLVTNQPFPLKAIKKVLIWCDPDQSLNFSVIEKEFITQQLHNYGVTYDLFEGSQCTKELFGKLYSNPDYDLIWLMCHGKFNPDDPTDSELIIEMDNPITARELSSLDFSDKSRRILVLNACQSSSSAVRFNSMGFLGLAPLLTSEYQSVIGHLWTVDFTASTILGSFLANALVKGSSPSKALSDSINIMKCGNETVIEEMKKINKDFDLIKEYTSKNMKDLFYSCSPIMFM